MKPATSKLSMLIRNSLFGRLLNKDWDKPNRDILFDLPSFICPTQGLDSLEHEFSTDEIDDIIKKLPNDKSTSPDGFSNEFIKK